MRTLFVLVALGASAGCGDARFPSVDFNSETSDAGPAAAHCRSSGFIADTDTDPEHGNCCGGHYSAGPAARCCNGGIGSPCTSDLDCCGSYGSPYVVCIVEGRGSPQGHCCVAGPSCAPICN